MTIIKKMVIEEQTEIEPIKAFEFILNLDNLRALVEDTTKHRIHVILESYSQDHYDIPTIVLNYLD